MTIPAQITFSQQFLLDSLSSSRSTCSTRAIVQPSSCAQSVDFIVGCSTSSLLNIYYSARFNLSICFLIFLKIYFYRPYASISRPILCYKFSALHVEHLPEYTFRFSCSTHLSELSQTMDPPIDALQTQTLVFFVRCPNLFPCSAP